MWGPELREAFEADGHVTLKGAFDPSAAARMSEAIWNFVEARTDVRRDDRTSWPDEWVEASFKKLKRHSAFQAVLDSVITRSALNGIFGEGSWWPSRGGAQILFTFPTTAPREWRVPSKLWHMDSSFSPRVSPPAAVKLFSVVEPLSPRGGATMVLAGTPRLQAAYARNVPAEERKGDAQTWRRFICGEDPWLAQFAIDNGEPDRNAVLAQPHDVNGLPVQLRELGGEPGDVHLTHINLFHSASPNAGDRPRMLVTHLVSQADDQRG